MKLQKILDMINEQDTADTMFTVDDAFVIWSSGRERATIADKAYPLDASKRKPKSKLKYGTQDTWIKEYEVRLSITDDSLPPQIDESGIQTHEHGSIYVKFDVSHMKAYVPAQYDHITFKLGASYSKNQKKYYLDKKTGNPYLRARKPEKIEVEQEEGYELDEPEE